MIETVIEIELYGKRYMVPRKMHIPWVLVPVSAPSLLPSRV